HDPPGRGPPRVRRQESSHTTCRRDAGTGGRGHGRRAAGRRRVAPGEDPWAAPPVGSDPGGAHRIGLHGPRRAPGLRAGGRDERTNLGAPRTGPHGGSGRSDRGGPRVYVPLLVAGSLGLLGAGVHGVGCEVLVVRRISPSVLPSSPFGGPVITKAMIRATWHMTTIAFLTVGSVLVLSGS